MSKQGQAGADLSTLEDEPEANPARPASRQVDILQLLFWASLLMAIAAASVALAWPQASGPAGPILLTAMGAGFLVFMLWTLRGAGRVLGLFPERGSAARATQAASPRFQWIEALDEAVLITDQGGAPVAANAAYTELSANALIIANTEAGPVTIDRLFGANPGLAAPVYRLSRAAKAGQARREILPPVPFGQDQVPAQFEVSVSSLSRTQRVLWRIRRIAGREEATGPADLKSLYVEDAPMGFFATRADGTITYANSWLRDLTGLAETVRNVRVDDVMRPEFVKLISRDRKSGAPGRADILLRGRDGIEVPVQAITTWTGKGTEAVGRTVLLANTPLPAHGDDRPSFGAPPRAASGESDPMFDDAPFGVVRLEGDSVETAIILDSNRALAEITQGAAIPGKRFADLFKVEDATLNVGSQLLEAMNSPAGLLIDSEVPRYVNVSIALDRNRRPSVAYVMDVTELRHMEQSLAKVDRMQMIGQIAGKVAHDFNNALYAISLNNYTLLQRHPLGDPSYDNLRHINEWIERSRILVSGLLSYSRQQTLKRNVIRITEFFADFDMMRSLPDERVDLQLRHGRDLPAIFADAGQLQRVIMNLVMNARDAILEKNDQGIGRGNIIISTQRATEKHAHERGFHYVNEGEYLHISVEDNGCGMPKDVMEKIFDIFYTTKPEGKGNGLGLSTSYGIIKQSGGFICATSAVGKGTTFHIYLPALSAEELANLEAEAPAEPVKAIGPQVMSGRGRILLIEDEAQIRDLSARLLRERGYEVDEAGDGEEALDILKEQPGRFDLILSDVIMPGIDGPALIREAREFLGEARVIFMSGYAEPDIAVAVGDDRAVSFLAKPVSLPDLAKRVKEELSKAPRKSAA